MPLNPGTIMATAQNLLCHEELLMPLVDKRQLAEMKFISFASTAAGDGDLFYAPGPEHVKAKNQSESLMVMRLNEKRSVATMFPPNLVPPGTQIIDLPEFRTLVQRVTFDCANQHKIVFHKFEYYDDANQLVYFGGPNLTNEVPSADFVDNSPLNVLRRITCSSSEAQK
jgi:hypothetical protein